MNMDAMMKECTKPHAIMHLVTGFGLGMLATNFLGLTGDMGTWLGLGLVVVGVVGDFMVQSKGK